MKYDLADYLLLSYMNDKTSRPIFINNSIIMKVEK